MRSAFTLTFLHVLLIPLTAWSAEPAPMEADVERIARQFRLRTYQVFRHNRPEYDRRLAWVEKELTAQSADGWTQPEVERLQHWVDAVESTPPYPGAILPAYSEISATVVKTPTSPSSVSSPGPSIPAGVARPKTSIERVPPSVELRKKLPDSLDDDVSAQQVPLRDSVRLPHRSPSSREVSAHRWRTPQVIANQENSSPSTRPMTPSGHPVEPTVNVRADIPAADAGPVNLTVLRAKIRSYNLSRSALENELLEDPFSDSASMDAIVHQLDELIGDFRLVNLYYSSLSSSAQSRLESPVEIASLLQLAEARCRELQRGGGQLAEESDQLAVLVHRLQEMTFDLHSDQELP